MTKPAPTGTNLFVLAELFGAADTIANQLHATDVPHVRRLVRFGLVVISSRTELTLTDAGKLARTTYVAERDAARNR